MLHVSHENVQFFLRVFRRPAEFRALIKWASVMILRRHSDNATARPSLVDSRKLARAAFAWMHVRHLAMPFISRIWTRVSVEIATAPNRVLGSIKIRVLPLIVLLELLLQLGNLSLQIF